MLRRGNEIIQNAQLKPQKSKNKQKQQKENSNKYGKY